MFLISRSFGRKLRDKTGRFFGPMYFLYLLVADWKSVRFFPRWVSSFRSSSHSVRDGIPWLPFELTEWIGCYLTGEMNVFEFGSGGSTIFIAPRVKHLVTVEHDQTWFEAVSVEIMKRDILNVTYLLCEPTNVAPTRSIEYWDNFGNEYPNHSFERYVKAIDDYHDGFFDLILIDGRARKFCIEHAIRKAKPNGYIVVDNSSCVEYFDFYGPLERFPRCDITSISPFWPPARWQATRWQITCATP